ncbi:MAG: hypothetical protein WCD35_08320, partial [Mycobacteriales bacterium]
MTDVDSDALTTSDIAGQPQERSAAPAPDDAPARLLEDSDDASFRRRWSDVQSRFVDDPRSAVQEADSLVAELMRSLAQGFVEHKAALEQEWSQDREPDTER